MLHMEYAFHLRTDTSPPFNPLIHDPKYKYTDDDGKEKCSNLFATIVERGDIVNTGEVFCDTYWCHNQKSMEFSIYSSYKKDVWYVTGKRGKGERSIQKAKVHKIGTFTIDMPILEGDKS